MDNIPQVYLRAYPEDNDLVSGKFPPQRVKTEEQDSVNMLVRSENRIYGTNYNFQIDLQTSTAHIRKMTLSKVGIPLLPQINEKNKSVTVTHTNGTVTFNLIEGYYSVQSLVNMMQAQFLAAWQSLDATNLVTISYNIEKRTIRITDDNGENFYIHSESNFARYGFNVVRFPTLPAGSPLPIGSTLISNSLGMIYSRFILLTSSRMTEDQKSYSIVSGSGPQNIVAIIDLASHYKSEQFTVSSSFPGTDVVIDTHDYSPRINVLNRNKSFKVMDFQLIDEFGFCLDELDTNTFDFEYPVFFWFSCFL